MIASPIYQRKSFREKAAPTLLKYVSQRSLAVLLFIALAFLASLGKKSSDKRDPGLRRSLAIPKARDQQTYLSITSWRPVDRIVASIEDTFNDPELIEYASEQQIPDSLMTGRPEEQSTCSTPNDSDPIAAFTFKSSLPATDIGNKNAANR
jgi:hypothetical protein